MSFRRVDDARSLRPGSLANAFGWRSLNRKARSLNKPVDNECAGGAFAVHNKKGPPRPLTGSLRLRTLRAIATPKIGIAAIFDGPWRAPFMPRALDKKVGEWRAADSKAREAENAVARLLLQNVGPAATEMLVKEAKSLRKAANEKLKLAIAAIKPKA
jgi:hypothetical protein